VPCFRKTRNCSGVRVCFHSSSVFMISYLLVALVESTAIAESVGKESVDFCQNWYSQAPPMSDAPASNKSLFFMVDMTV